MLAQNALNDFFPKFSVNFYTDVLAKKNVRGKSTLAQVGKKLKKSLF